MSAEFALFEPDDLGFVRRVRDCFEHTYQQLIGVEIPDHVANEWSWTLWTPYGAAVACCGITNAGEAWALIDPEIRPGEIKTLYHKTQAILHAHSLRRGPVFATVRRDVPASQRWASRLGFTPFKGECWVY